MPMCTCLITVLGSGNTCVSQISDSNFGEEKRGQFLGATLKSTGDDFLVRRQIELLHLHGNETWRPYCCTGALKWR